MMETQGVVEWMIRTEARDISDDAAMGRAKHKDSNSKSTLKTQVHFRPAQSAYVDKLIAHINRKVWWHVPPADSRAYQKRGKFFASTFREAEFYGRPKDEAERVCITAPLIGDNDAIERKLLGKVESQPEITVRKRLSLDAELRRAAVRKGFDSIVLLTPRDMEALKKKGKMPRSIELNVVNLRCLRR
jgi:hypothetical protein